MSHDSGGTSQDTTRWRYWLSQPLRLGMHSSNAYHQVALLISCALIAERGTPTKISVTHKMDYIILIWIKRNGWLLATNCYNPYRNVVSDYD